MSWDTEKAVWWRALRGILKVQPPDSGLLMTEPLFNLPAIQSATMQVWLGRAAMCAALLHAPQPPFAVQQTKASGCPNSVHWECTAWHARCERTGNPNCGILGAPPRCCGTHVHKGGLSVGTVFQWCIIQALPVQQRRRAACADGV